MAKLKTQENTASVENFIEKINDEKKKQDALTLLSLFEKTTKSKAKMWGGSIIGFGKTKLKYASGREVDWMKAGFSPRKRNFSIYLTCDISQYGNTLSKLGKHKTGKGCLYVNKLSDINIDMLKELILESLNEDKKY